MKNKNKSKNKEIRVNNKKNLEINCRNLVRKIGLINHKIQVK